MVYLKGRRRLAGCPARQRSAQPDTWLDTDCAGFRAGERRRRRADRIRTDRRRCIRFRCAVLFRAGELVTTSSAAPALPARDEAEPDHAATAAPGAARGIGDHHALEIKFPWITDDPARVRNSPCGHPGNPAASSENAGPFERLERPRSARLALPLERGGDRPDQGGIGHRLDQDIGRTVARLRRPPVVGRDEDDRHPERRQLDGD